jgi:hypothetical protein
MVSVNRNYAWLICAVAAAATVVICLAVFRKPLTVAYNSWRMNAEYNSIFGHPKPVGDALASYDVTDLDVDAVLERYFRHRQALVNLGALCHVSARFPRLTSKGTEQQSLARSAFVNRMRSQFPGHKHYYLSGDGTFESWVPAAEETAWKIFVDDETTMNLKPR